LSKLNTFTFKGSLEKTLLFKSNYKYFKAIYLCDTPRAQLVSFGKLLHRCHALAIPCVNPWSIDHMSKEWQCHPYMHINMHFKPMLNIIPKVWVYFIGSICGRWHGA